MVSGFGAGMGRAGAGLAKVGAGAVLGLGAAVLLARGAFRALMKLAPYSDDLATSLGNLVNVNEELKKRVAEALVPAVDSLATSLTEAAPMIAGAAVTMVEAAGAYLKKAQELSRPKPGIMSGATAVFSEALSRLIGDDKTADQTIREQFPEWFLNIARAEGGGNYGNRIFEPAEAGTDQLGPGAQGGGIAGDYRALVEAAQQTARNTSAQGAGF
tara:strand:+ start:41 stop:685 length:645 start_codon:yes stop_codon:yes gene_type:complete